MDLNIGECGTFTSEGIQCVSGKPNKDEPDVKNHRVERQREGVIRDTVVYTVLESAPPLGFQLYEVISHGKWGSDGFQVAKEYSY